MSQEVSTRRSSACPDLAAMCALAHRSGFDGGAVSAEKPSRPRTWLGDSTSDSAALGSICTSSSIYIVPAGER
jgi:hypothetical protein